MKIHTFLCNPYRECTYVLLHERQTYVIDPGMYSDYEVQQVMSCLHEQERQGYPLAAILITHYHPDHVCGLETLKQAYPALPVIDFQHHNSLPNGCQMIATPGHKEDAVCYYWQEDNLLFSGDTLFLESIGRTDLPGGDMTALIRSLALLKQLPEDTQVYPGHGETTTIGHERDYNPYL